MRIRLDRKPPKRLFAGIAFERQYAFRREGFANRLGNAFSDPIEIIRLSEIKERKDEEIIGERRNRAQAHEYHGLQKLHMPILYRADPVAG